MAVWSGHLIALRVNDSCTGSCLISSPASWLAQIVRVPGFLCASSVLSVSLWCAFVRNSSTTETQRAQRTHREGEGCRVKLLRRCYCLARPEHPDRICHQAARFLHL